MGMDIYDRMWESQDGHHQSFPLVFPGELGSTKENKEVGKWEILINLFDPGLAEHAKRVDFYARKLGGFYGLANSDMEDFTLAALTHDLGKLSYRISPALRMHLEVEPEIFRNSRERHVIIGNSLLQLLGPKLPGICFEVLQQHHEDWNGGGYPKGLKEDEICLEAQIFRYADAFDSATAPKRATSRQCSEDFDHKKHILINGERFMRGINASLAMQTIMERIGTRFSPHLRPAFTRFIEWYFEPDVNQMRDPNHPWRVI